ncbi:SDR family oxidoreductase [Novosphingobium sp.]|uniref:SDR family NAD(P)-dependent oxidoreductase n=1 Tax=Novosphingobium sp. TaxID=1874826 RepID=UPI002611F078|nr:SDR family oxidoreductase [Novosphingobium sp.]
MTVPGSPWIDLTGRVAAVTGAASGIGRAASHALANAGATVLLLDCDADAAAAVAWQICDVGGRAEARALDVASAADWQEVGDWIGTSFGRLDVLVNSAGVALKDSVGDAGLTNYHRTFAINVEGSLLGMEVALGFMRRAGKGAIINLSSSASLRGNPMMASYGASKAAIAHLTRSAAVEVLRAGHDIRINAVHPGLIETAMAGDLYKIYDRLGSPDAVRAAFTTGRSGRPEEVADLILFLASDRASYISGTSIVIDRAASA